ncbi:hypothetical protein DAI22_05g027100 [Oryza sativa Japonica Group]|nr:hypothetical protein DAI22_05g027100 [Oryza sativa Japonica Group]
MPATLRHSLNTMPTCPPCSTVFTAAASAPQRTAMPDAHAPASPEPMNAAASAAAPASASPWPARRRGRPRRTPTLRPRRSR